MLLQEKNNHQAYPSGNLMSYTNDWPGKTFSLDGVIVAPDHRSNQLLCDWI